MTAVVNKIATPMPPAMRWSLAVEGRSLNSRKKHPLYFI
jgi:hypothetical protein